MSAEIFELKRFQKIMKLYKCEIEMRKNKNKSKNNKTKNQAPKSNNTKSTVVKTRVITFVKNSEKLKQVLNARKSSAVSFVPNRHKLEKVLINYKNFKKIAINQDWEDTISKHLDAPQVQVNQKILNKIKKQDNSAQKSKAMKNLRDIQRGAKSLLNQFKVVTGKKNTKKGRIKV